MDMHFSQQTSRLETTAHEAHALVRVHAHGFVTAEMIQQAAARFASDPDAPEGRAARVLIDLRDAMGYGAGSAMAAKAWVSSAVAGGVCRLAFIAPSSVVRTSGQLIATGIDADLQFFEHEAAACAWLGIPHPHHVDNPGHDGRAEARAS